MDAAACVLGTRIGQRGRNGSGEHRVRRARHRPANQPDRSVKRGLNRCGEATRHALLQRCPPHVRGRTSVRPTRVRAQPARHAAIVTPLDRDLIASPCLRRLVLESSLDRSSPPRHRRSRRSATAPPARRVMMSTVVGGSQDSGATHGPVPCLPRIDDRANAGGSRNRVRAAATSANDRATALRGNSRQHTPRSRYRVRPGEASHAAAA